jgi:endoglucanase
VSATLQARFSRWLSWQIEVVAYDEPVLSDATGTTDTLTMPTRYKGDVLAAMGARYGGGRCAGQTYWTPYQEFNPSFRPDHPNDTIILPSKVLDSLRDGELVTLPFHFYRGKKVMHHVRKSEDSVTGTHVASRAHVSTGQ